ncbi:MULTISPECIES: type II toxin-antitoxin system RelE/ParE family toxin [Yersinia]|jgi:toxin ParE1/3/4|uniref:type II toxin-antitoxin system RelE/ParE family toxin n=1 Tax=Yersinia TaxID=629 RepID=UPI0005E8DBF8|nr:MULTISPECIES: type II toxin-antitoxin system mRNA interferase toxin, RelE/StbE family [Yersinia]ARB82655.1 type II toxin-antitoxin system mRNA interferase toxin, RelE/StbE family [Yersinia sp. FDAARGOS_228]AVL36386.1 type II toxin-antitoxin system mRNA interferase toxin, RelE/StbE family [Yersinia intermedia]MCB5298248.1 type II toxin-antitoxin system mRNA interferase toxin, RelE/StbE family [Yersinia intermedia]MDA5493432.1 type II toxin-antitoxin system mRNA interferase toxin, RelE/StbE fa
MLPIKWTDEAKTDLYALIAFITEENPYAAESLLHQLEDSVLPATEHPYMFRSGRVPGTREMVAHPNYVIIYQVMADQISVLNVVHSRQEYP